MSTRAQVSFQYKYGTDDVPTRVALVYCHSDGYPDAPHGLGYRIEKFFQEVKKQCQGDTRFKDPEYLAAKFVVFLAKQYQNSEQQYLNFLSVGVCIDEHDDIDYLYRINCSKINPETGFPEVTVEEK